MTTEIKLYILLIVAEHPIVISSAQHVKKNADLPSLGVRLGGTLVTEPYSAQARTSVLAWWS